MTEEDLLYKGDHRKPEDRDRQKRARPAKGDTIEQRPEEINSRDTFGNWEMDSVMGCKGSKAALVVLTERLTRYPVIVRVPDHTMESVVRALDRMERRMGAKFREVFRSITVDNGCEFQDCEGMERSKRARKPRTKIFYCHPYSAYERGSNENMNRIIRRFFPKGTNFDKHNRLEAAVLFAIQYQVSTAVSYSEIVARINAAPLKKSQSHRLNDQIAAKEKELTKITRYKQSLYQDWKDGEISQQEYREMKADYERQAAGLSDLLARLTAERKQLSNGVDQQHPALVAFAKYQNIEKLTREILIELVDHIKVYENGNISVHFKFADEFRRIAEYIEINTTDTAEAG